MKTARIGGYARRIDCALDFLLNAIDSGTVSLNPEDLEAALNRAISSGARLHRNRSLTLMRSAPPPETPSTEGAAESSIELVRIRRTVKEADGRVLLAAGLGYTDRQIAERNVSTPGAVRVRLSRLRLKLTG